MKTLKLFFSIMGIIASCSINGSQISKQYKTTRQEWAKFDRFDSKAPKLSAPALSQELPKPPIYGVLAQSIYGDGKTTKTPYQAIADFDRAQAMAQQSRDLGGPLPLSTFYNSSRTENEATQLVYDEIAQSPDKRTLSVSVETLHMLSVHLPPRVKHAFADTVTVKIEKPVDRKIEHLIIKAGKGAVILGTGAAIASIAEKSSQNALKETEKVLWAHKNDIAKEVLIRSGQVVANHGIRAIDSGLSYAGEQLNETDFGKVGGHCDYQSFHESNTYFTNVVTQAGSVLKDEFIHAGIQFGIELAVEHAPGAILQAHNVSIDFDDVCYGTAIGACAGLGYGILTMDEPIAEIPLSDI